VKTDDGVCAERVLLVSLGYGVFPCFGGVGVSWSVGVGCQGLTSMYCNVAVIADGVF
jgi:hypothetical protein